ncbi:adenosylhomocysteinase [Spirillospora sp. NPDC050679]
MTEWTQGRMPLMRRIRERFGAERPLAGWQVVASVHLIASTVPLLLAVRDAGATLLVCASNPMSTDDEVARWLARQDVQVLGSSSDSPETSARYREQALQRRPHLIIDEADALLGLLHSQYRHVIPHVRGASVHTLTGVRRMRSMAARGRLDFPVMAVDGSPIKQIFDNRIGTGQSTVDALLRTANVAFPGACTVVIGYGHCGRGVAERVRDLGSEVVIVEVDPLRALEAAMSGYRVMPMAEAAPRGDVFITATGTVHVVTGADLARMKSGVLLANAGHSQEEIDVSALRTADGPRRLLPMLEEYRDERGRRRFVLAEGGPVNTSAAAGHPPELMDISFAAQALGIEHLVRHADDLEAGVHSLPLDVQRQIAGDKLTAMGIRLASSTDEQRRYTEQLSEETDEEFDRSAQRQDS